MPPRPVVFCFHASRGPFYSLFRRMNEGIPQIDLASLPEDMSLQDLRVLGGLAANMSPMEVAEMVGVSADRVYTLRSRHKEALEVLSRHYEIVYLLPRVQGLLHRTLERYEKALDKELEKPATEIKSLVPAIRILRDLFLGLQEKRAAVQSSSARGGLVPVSGGFDVTDATARIKALDAASTDDSAGGEPGDA